MTDDPYLLDLAAIERPPHAVGAWLRPRAARLLVYAHVFAWRRLAAANRRTRVWQARAIGWLSAAYRLDPPRPERSVRESGGG